MCRDLIRLLNADEMRLALYMANQDGYSLQWALDWIADKSLNDITNSCKLLWAGSSIAYIRKLSELIASVRPLLQESRLYFEVVFDQSRPNTLMQFPLGLASVPPSACPQQLPGILEEIVRVCPGFEIPGQGALIDLRHLFAPLTEARACIDSGWTNSPIDQAIRASLLCELDLCVCEVFATDHFDFYLLMKNGNLLFLEHEEPELIETTVELDSLVEMGLETPQQLSIP